MSRKKVKAKRERTDQERLELFLECFEEIARLEALKQGLSVNHSIKWSQTEDGHSQLDEPTDRDLRSLIGPLRKLLANDSDIQLNKIHGIVYKHMRPSDQASKYKADLAEANRRWNYDFTHGVGTVTINGVEINPQHAWNTWINGKYLHDDMDYRDELQPLAGPSLFRDAHRARLLDGVISTLNYAKWLYQNIAFFLANDVLDLPPSSSPSA